MRGPWCLAVLVLALGCVTGRAFVEETPQNRWKNYVAEHSSRPLARMLQDAPATAPPVSVQVQTIVGAIREAARTGNTRAISTYINILLKTLGVSQSQLNSLLGGPVAGRRRLGEDDEDEDVAPEAHEGKALSLQTTKEEEVEGYCFPLAANEDQYQPVLTDCKVVDKGFEDAGACCVECTSTTNCTGFSYISGGQFEAPRCCLAIRESYPLLAFQGVDTDISNLDLSGILDGGSVDAGQSAAVRRRGLLQTAESHAVQVAPAVGGYMSSDYLGRAPQRRTWGEYFKGMFTAGLRLFGLAREPRTPFERMAYQNPKIVQKGFGLNKNAVLNVQDSGAPGLVYLSPDSGFQIISGITQPAMYSLNWYGCPYDKDYDNQKCNKDPPPSCRCVDEECTGYCAGLTSHNYAMPKIDYYGQQSF
eukprot:jgi/Botrbrau1/5241/Bobra.0172s0103.1